MGSSMSGRCDVCLGRLPGGRIRGWCRECCRQLAIRNRIMSYDWNKYTPVAADHAERIERYRLRALAGKPLFEESP